MRIIQGVTFRDQVVRLDGKHFKDCIFTDCKLEYGGADVVLERTSIHGCTHMLYGSARQTAEYMRVVGLCDDTPDKWTEYTGIVH